MHSFKIEKDYPKPIVDEKQSYQKAKETIFNWKKSWKVKQHNQAIYEKLGSRKNQHFPKVKRG